MYNSIICSQLSCYRTRANIYKYLCRTFFWRKGENLPKTIDNLGTVVVVQLILKDNSYPFIKTITSACLPLPQIETLK